MRGRAMGKQLSDETTESLLKTLAERFNDHMHRHPDMIWDEMKQKLMKQPEKLWSLHEMEKTGGEPDVVGNDFLFIDCSKESPTARRSLCYDKSALEARKKNPPKSDAQTMAAEMKVEILTEEDYRKLQSVEPFDLKTSTWVKTPDKIRKLGGAIFCDRRYETVFTYHNGADSYYASRGFRGKLQV